MAIQEWSMRHHRAYRYAMVSLGIGGVLGMSLIGAFTYLVMQGHGGYAAGLLGTSAVGLVLAF